MEKFEKKLPPATLEERLENFKDEFRKLKSDNLEKRERGEDYDSHFDFINPETLREKELFLWEILKKPNTEEDIVALEKDIGSYEEEKAIEAGNRLTAQGLQGDDFDRALWSDPGVNTAGFLKNTLAKKILREQLEN